MPRILSEWIAYFRRELERSLADLLPNNRFDLSDVMSRDRRISQRASSLVHASGDADGILYPSRHGYNLHNWALFEPFDLNVIGNAEILSDDPDFGKAISLLDLEWDPTL